MQEKRICICATIPVQNEHLTTFVTKNYYASFYFIEMEKVILFQIDQANRRVKQFYNEMTKTIKQTGIKTKKNNAEINERSNERANERKKMKEKK